MHKTLKKRWLCAQRFIPHKGPKAPRAAKAPKVPEAPKAPKAPKGSKARKASKSPKAQGARTGQLNGLDKNLGLWESTVRNSCLNL